MSINRFPFVYKNWYYWLIFFTNIFISVILFSYWKFSSSFEEIKYLSPAVIFLFLIFLIIYSKRTLIEHKVCVSAFRHSHKYISKFLIGVFCSFVSINVGFIICTVGIYKSGSIFNGFLLACSIVSGLLGIISNIFINLFEFKIHFEFFYRRYKDNVFKDIVDSIAERKKQIQERYGKHRRIQQSN